MSLLSKAEIQKGISDLDGWEYVDGSIKKTFSFDTYMDSINFINKLAEKAEEENHHPDLSFGWGYCKIKIFTHAIKGLAESDFILAAKIDKII